MDQSGKTSALLVFGSLDMNEGHGYDHMSIGDV